MEKESEKIYLEVTEIKEIGEGMRVCIDFVDILDQSDGLFVGNTGHGYIKVLSENRYSEGYPPRPFRINVGAFHQYLYQEKKSVYLHEVTAGEKIIITGKETERELPVGRVKIEKRPLMRMVCQNEEQSLSATLQNSSSVHLEEEEQGQVSIQNLKVGDRILCRLDEPGRHLGEKTEEEIIEK